MKQFFITLVFIFFCHSFFSQKQFDSLRQVIATGNADQRVTACTALAWRLKGKNLDSAIYYALRSEKLITKEVPELTKAYCYHIIGAVYCSAEKWDEAYPWLFKAYEIRKKEKSEVDLIATLTNMVYACQARGDIKKIHAFSLEAEQLCDRIADKNSKLYIITLTQLADIYNELNRKDKSEELYNKAITAAETKMNVDNLILAYQNYASFLISKEEYPKALLYMEKAIKYQETINKPEELFDSKTNMAIIYAETGKRQEAFKIFKEIYEYRKSKNGFYDRSTTSNNLAFFYYTENNFKEAVKYFLESLECAKKAKANKLVMQRYQMLGETYESLKDVGSALKYVKLYQAMKDSIYNVETVTQLNSITEKYGNEKKERKILELQKNNAEMKLQEETVKREAQKRNIIFGVIILFVVVIAAFIYYSLVQKKKANSELQTKNVQIEHQHALLAEKQKEILDSIHYAQKIQKALITSEKYIERNLDKLSRSTKN